MLAWIKSARHKNGECWQKYFALNNLAREACAVFPVGLRAVKSYNALWIGG